MNCAFPIFKGLESVKVFSVSVQMVTHRHTRSLLHRIPQPQPQPWPQAEGLNLTPPANHITITKIWHLPQQLPWQTLRNGMISTGLMTRATVPQGCHFPYLGLTDLLL